jgi:LuxR family quorum sensing-dependent transcriptional regulator
LQVETLINMREFSDICHDLIRSETLAAVGEVFRAGVLEQGYTVSLCPVVSSPSPAPPLQWLFRNLTPAWEEFSDQQKIPQRSPALMAARRRLAPFTFVEVFDDPALSPEQQWIWQMAREWGWQNGFVVPVHGPRGYFSYVSIASPERDLDLRIENRVRLQMLALLAHDRCSTLNLAERPDAAPHSASKLSERERECMRWVAAGKTDWEIGPILVISSSTAHFHIENARRKLGASTRAQAVAILFVHGQL